MLEVPDCGTVIGSVDVVPVAEPFGDVVLVPVVDVPVVEVDGVVEPTDEPVPLMLVPPLAPVVPVVPTLVPLVPVVPVALVSMPLVPVEVPAVPMFPVPVEVAELPFTVLVPLVVLVPVDPVVPAVAAGFVPLSPLGFVELPEVVPTPA